MKTSHVFKKAKRILARNYKETKWQWGERNKREQFICIALCRLASDGEITKADRHRCEKIVMDLLGGYGTLESWLIEQGHAPGTPFTGAHHTKVQVTRHAWLAHLIAHYKAKGD